MIGQLPGNQKARKPIILDKDPPSMKQIIASSGYFQNSMPFSRTGHGARRLVVFQDLMFENKPPSKLLNRMYKFLEEDYTVYSVLRKPNMPHGYTLQDMANDYATMIQDEFSGLIDVIGISTGGSIVQHFAADRHLDRRIDRAALRRRSSRSGEALYRRLARGESLPQWHPLITGTKKSVEDAGVAVMNAVRETEVDDKDIWDYVTAARPKPRKKKRRR